MPGDALLFCPCLSQGFVLLNFFLAPVLPLTSVRRYPCKNKLKKIRNPIFGQVPRCNSGAVPRARGQMAEIHFASQIPVKMLMHETPCTTCGGKLQQKTV